METFYQLHKKGKTATSETTTPRDDRGYYQKGFCEIWASQLNLVRNDSNYFQDMTKSSEHKQLLLLKVQVYKGTFDDFDVQLGRRSNKHHRVQLSFLSKTRGRLLNLAENSLFQTYFSNADWRDLFVQFTHISAIVSTITHVCE